MDANSIRSFLEAQGYQLLEREEVWAECLLLLESERWIGRGRDRDEALLDAIAAAFPSKAARAALDRVLAAPAIEKGSEQPLAAETGAIETPETGALDSPAIEPRTEEPVAAQPAAEEFLLVSTPLPEAEPATSPAFQPPTRPNEAALLEELATIERRIHDGRAEMARVAPHRLRLVILGHLARARACQEEAPRSAAIAGCVARIVRELRVLVESWWPGRIAAFQLRARPADAWRDLRESQPAHHGDWRSVASAAAQALLRAEAEDASEGRDADGWADAAWLQPRPADPEAFFAELLSEVEQAGGDVRGKQPRDVAVPDGAQLVAWSQRARWLRGAVEDERWGALVGRLRYWSQLGTAGVPAREILDAGYRPCRKYAAELLSAEELQRREAELGEVLAEAPGPGADRDAVIGWLLRALPLTTDHAAAIAAAATPLRSSIATVEEADLPGADRRIRRRLQRLKRSLAGEPAEPLEPAESTDSGDRAEPASAAGPEAPAPARDPEAPISEAILAHTAGLRVLFVSNRTESELQERLVDLYRFGALAWEEAAPRRLAAAVQAIGAGSYDLVLGATGFLGHADDGQLARACKSAGIPYVRVDKGKITGVRLALERDLIGSRG